MDLDPKPNDNKENQTTVKERVLANLYGVKNEAVRKRSF